MEMQKLNLSDPLIRAMADRSHVPVERWKMTEIGSILESVLCLACHNRWPCGTRLALITMDVTMTVTTNAEAMQMPAPICHMEHTQALGRWQIERDALASCAHALAIQYGGTTQPDPEDDDDSNTKLRQWLAMHRAFSALGTIDTRDVESVAVTWDRMS